MGNNQSLGRRVVDAVVISLACAGALWVAKDPNGAGDVVDRFVDLIGGLDPVWFAVAVWTAGILLALASSVVLLRLTDWGSPFSFSVRPIVGASAVSALVAASLWLCAGGSFWGAMAAALAIWLAVRIGLSLRRAWARLWNPMTM